MKPHQQFSLAALMLAMTLVAVVFAVFPYPFVAYNLLLTLFFVAAILFRFGPREARAFWRWFAICGWLYVLLGTSALELIETTSLWLWIRSWLEQWNPSPKEWLREDYLIFAHWLVALCMALAGGVCIPGMIRLIKFASGYRPSDSKPNVYS